MPGDFVTFVLSTKGLCDNDSNNIYYLENVISNMLKALYNNISNYSLCVII